jgi:hypothetical protein
VPMVLRKLSSLSPIQPQNSHHWLWLAGWLALSVAPSTKRFWPFPCPRQAKPSNPLIAATTYPKQRNRTRREKRPCHGHVRPACSLPSSLLPSSLLPLIRPARRVMLVSLLARLLLLLPQISSADASRLEEIAESQQGGHLQPWLPALQSNRLANGTSELQRAYLERKRARDELRAKEAGKRGPLAQAETAAGVSGVPPATSAESGRCTPIDDKGRKQLIQVSH